MSDIQYVYPLIHNKVTSPHYVTPTLRRARLIDWLNENSGCRAVVVAADAGYGKTTLLWQWEREVEFPCYWYKLDRNDRDWSLHISYLIEAISQRHAGFGRRAHSMLEQMGGPGTSRPGVAAYLLAEMHERLTEPCTFIIDDWQFVASVTEVRGLWNQILRDAPPTCRFVFLSRAKPQLQFARFKTHGGYAEMRTDALRFNDLEIEELFRDVYNDPLNATELAELERRTEGWAVSLQLVEVSLRERKGPDERQSFLQSITATRDSDLVEFLSQEVLDQQPPQLRNFLLATSILHRITPDLAARLAGEHDGAGLLEDLEGRGLFTYRLGSDGQSYRYHGLFRDFLERRLMSERSGGEVTALHIHAASYFETTRSWPEAIHHYLQAGLHPQAARLIAKYGDDLATAGRLPLLDEWLQLLPQKSVADNARLSLLQGEMAGIRGDWEAAVRALERARGYFSRKGDRRMEAVAYSKLSTVYNNRGDTNRCNDQAEHGLALASEDDIRTRLRLRGNVATTTTFMRSLEQAEHDCRRVADEADAAGLEHYAAIAHHNLGIFSFNAGRLDESINYLERAAAVWDSSPANPFADNSELVQALLMRGDLARASAVAAAAIERTRPWVRPNAEARFGLALVRVYEGRLSDAIEILQKSLLAHRDQLGSVREKVASLLVECLYLAGTRPDELERLLVELEATDGDPRLAPLSSVASAVAAHRLGRCDGHCRRAHEILDQWSAGGSHLVAAIGRIPMALMAIEHQPRRGVRLAVRALEDLSALGGLRFVRRWLGRFVVHAGAVAEFAESDTLFANLIAADPEAWIPAASRLLPGMSIPTRSVILRAIEGVATKSTIDAVRDVDGADVQDLTRRLVNRFAERILIHTFGAMTIHRGDWEMPGVPVPRKRMRLVLGLMVASYQTGLSRDQVVDTLWPDSDPSAAVNSLNQTIFQLRRLFEGGDGNGESPQYILTSAESLQLNRDLVRTDLGEFHELSREFHETRDRNRRVELANFLVSIARGEFLSDIRYEDWVADHQLAVHTDMRAFLLPIANGLIPELGDDAAVAAGRVLTLFDPFDESAHLAIAQRFASSGRRQQARVVLRRFADRIRQDLDEEPSEQLQVAGARVGIDLGPITVD